jgi:hypothetical protein
MSENNKKLDLNGLEVEMSKFTDLKFLISKAKPVF